MWQKWTLGNYRNAGMPSFLMKDNGLKWSSKPCKSRKKMFIGMSNIKCYYRNSKCNPSLVPVYYISVPKDFLLWEKKWYFGYAVEIKSPITSDFAMARVVNSRVYFSLCIFPYWNSLFSLYLLKEVKEAIKCKFSKTELAEEIRFA